MTLQERTIMPEYERAMQSLQEWARTSGAHLLVIDPMGDDGAMRIGMAARGVHVTWVSSAIDGLIKFGRIRPRAVIVSPELGDLPAADVVAAILREEPVTVIAGVDANHVDAAAPLLSAGADTTLVRPYTVESVWALLVALVRGLDEHARMVFGPMQLDATAYTVRIHGVRVPDLPRKQFEVLRSLMYRAPEVVSDEELSVAVWGAPQRGGSGSTMGVTVRRLRKRLRGGVEIRRITGHGYALSVAGDAPEQNKTFQIARSPETGP